VLLLLRVAPPFCLRFPRGFRFRPSASDRAQADPKPVQACPRRRSKGRPEDRLVFSLSLSLSCARKARVVLRCVAWCCVGSMGLVKRGGNVSPVVGRVCSEAERQSEEHERSVKTTSWPLSAVGARLYLVGRRSSVKTTSWPLSAVGRRSSVARASSGRPGGGGTCACPVSPSRPRFVVIYKGDERRTTQHTRRRRARNLGRAAPRRRRGKIARAPAASLFHLGGRRRKNTTVSRGRGGGRPG